VIDTHYHEQFSTPEMMKGYVSGIPLGRVGTPEEVAAVFAFWHRTLPAIWRAKRSRSMAACSWIDRLFVSAGKGPRL
jgi:NAD(P)-dependent dehydrogenase (short-subunit alcohol dehydrogenase family)